MTIALNNLSSKAINMMEFDGAFECEHCGAITSPDDESGNNTTIVLAVQTRYSISSNVSHLSCELGGMLGIVCPACGVENFPVKVVESIRESSNEEDI